MKKVINEVRRMQQLAGLVNEDIANQQQYGYQDPEFKEISIPLMNDMLNDCMDNYEGDFENWLEYGMSQPSQEIQAGLEKLEQMSSPEEVEKFEAAAYKQIRKYLKKNRSNR
jgi:hypothetical protein